MPDLNQFYLLDGVAAVVVLLSAWMAYMRGFVREVFSLGTWIGAVVATAYFYPQASQFVRQHIETQFAADLAAGIGVFFVSFIVLRLVTGAIAEAVASSEHNAVDRAAGFLFGILRGVLLLVIAYMAFAWFVPETEQPPWLTEAKVTPMLREGSHELEKLLPEGWKTNEQKAESLRELDRQAAEIERLHRGFNAPAPTVRENRAAND
ncbi:MAG: CvpA family protein [Alphaproteobacteria bacterium]|nr:CvpA family protein [Alphaproteobacteria bacterium]MCB9929981.1 CvpA family protein [Alphaproteobacteria bacterium]